MPVPVSAPWQSYRRKRNAFVGAVLGNALLFTLVLLFPQGNLLASYWWALTPFLFGWFAITGFRLAYWRCPRCNRPFFMGSFGGNLFARRCAHCHLPKWGDAEAPGPPVQLMPTKPLPLQIATVMLLGLGGGFAIGLLLAPLDLPIYSINDRTMGGREFAGLVGLPVGLMSVAFSLAGWGLLRHRKWSRPAILASAACLGFLFSWGSAIAPGGRVLDVHLLGIPLFVAISAWYLYLAQGPKKYFAALSQGKGVAPN